MKVTFSADFDSINRVNTNLQGILTNVQGGTKWATEEACRIIYEKSIEQVPKDTTTLLRSAFYEVTRRTGLKSYRYAGTVGYGGNGDPVNPRTGKAASQYMVEVHEDLSVYHRNGKAKFLEDPLREFADSGGLFQLFLSAVKRRLR